ncbi:MAG: hypothetical protein KKF58_03850 [Gammaproteobacteria bacterium]|nr:hypothetical protein [Gammaproteobacteria bacterium]MBU1447423.1 hypothetical protein [Gammaproteobacteria bacterium]MDD2928501.1 hypothetical protein [Sideroxydans sp.]MDD5471169.1 hypothetical protein [Sideroxydans sp.]
MNILQNKTVWIASALLLLMALTRYNHFGSALSLPDASYAVFFLGGLFLGRVRGALVILALLMIEAAMVDYYAINFREVSGWCVTSAYTFLVFAYGALWFIGRWYAPHHDLTLKGMAGLLLAGAVAGSAAFVIANVSFYLLAGYFDSMSVIQYVSSVAQYYGPYVAVAVFYIGSAAGAQMLFALLSGKNRQVDAR